MVLQAGNFIDLLDDLEEIVKEVGKIETGKKHDLKAKAILNSSF